MRRLRPKKPIKSAGPEIELDKYTLCIIQVPGGAGTGFTFLKPEWVVTAKHVVVREDGTTRTTTALFEDGPIPTELRFAHPQLDLAVLELRRSGKCRVPLFPGNTKMKSGGLLCVGHQPSVSDPADGRYSMYVSAVPKFEREVRERDGCEEISIIFPAPHGEGGPSGGPVLGYGGAVVAVVVQGFRRGVLPFMRATAIHPLLDYLTFPGWQPA